jgi:ribosomal protein S18 acetylase RimI-like enzyme
METLRIRRYVSADYPAVCGMDAGLFPGMGGPFLFRHIGELFPGLFFVAETTGSDEIAGYVLGGVHMDNPETGKLIRIGVHPAFHRMNCGTYLASALLEAFQDHGVQRVHLTVAETNVPALALYRKLGFTEKMRAEKYYYPDAARLILQLDF